MSQFEITLSDTSRIRGEYRAGSHVVVFSHGFDVRRDSKGLFSDIAHSLPEHFGFVLFDYHDYRGDTEYLHTLSEQAAILHQVVAWTKANLHPLELHLVAHSMGCTVASYAAEPSFSSVTYLAPPIHSGSGLRRFFTTHPGLITHSGHSFTVARRSGKTTHVTEAFLSEFESAQPEMFLRRYAASKPLSIIAAKEDRFMPPSIYDSLRKQHLAVEVIPGDHNFSDTARAGVCSAVVSKLIGHIVN